MNLESFGFPVDLYPERDAALLPTAKGSTTALLETVVSTLSAEAQETSGEHEVQDQGGTEVHAVEKKARAQQDPLNSLSGQVHQPSTSENRPASIAFGSLRFVDAGLQCCDGPTEGRASKMHKQD